MSFSPLSVFKPKGDESFTERMLKIVLMLGVIVLVLSLLIGLFMGVGIDTLFIWIIGGGVALILIFLASKGLASMLKPKPFSPQDCFKHKLIKLCKQTMPRNVHDIYLRGENMRSKSFFGKIVGLGFIPYFIAKEKKDKEGNIVYQKDADGNIKTRPVIEADGSKKQIPISVKENIQTDDGDIVFVVSTANGFLARIKDLIFPDYQIVRAHPSYCSELIGDVFIKDVNFFPVGDFLYPQKQCKEDIKQIMTQDQSETIIQTHKNFLDLVSYVTQMSLGADPTFQKQQIAQAENLERNRNLMPMQ